MRAKSISQQSRVVKSKNKKIQQQIFREMMQRNIVISKNFPKGFKNLEKNSQNMHDNKKSKLLNQKKLHSKIKIKLKKIQTNKKIKSIINIRISITIAIKQLRKALKNSWKRIQFQKKKLLKKKSRPKAKSKSKPQLKYKNKPRKKRKSKIIKKSKSPNKRNSQKHNKEKKQVFPECMSKLMKMKILIQLSLENQGEIKLIQVFHQ